MIEIHYRQVGMQKLSIRPGPLPMLYIPTATVKEMMLLAEWAYFQLSQPETLLNKARNMTNHELAREALEKTDDYFDGDGLMHLRVPA